MASAVRQVGGQFGSNFMLRHISSHPVELMLAAASLCAQGVLERHPGLRVAALYRSAPAANGLRRIFRLASGV